MQKWIIYLLLVVVMAEVVSALCWNPLELFCIFEEEEEAKLYEVSTSSEYKTIIGDNRTSEFEPQVYLSKWDDEVYMRVSYPTEKTIAPILEDNKVKWEDTDLDLHFYSIDENNFEFEIILKEEPISNIITLNIESENLNFYYQSALNETKQRPYIDYCTETECFDKDGKRRNYRPENIVGSYAVYHSSKERWFIDQAEAEKYKTGKAFHIYRPNISDSNGNWIWGELNIADGLMIITIPQEFLDKAVYPVYVDPTFGQNPASTPGSQTSDPNVINCYSNGGYTPGSSGTLTSICGYWYDTDNPDCTIEFAIYDEAGGQENDLITDTEQDTVSGDGWICLDVTSQETVTSQAYWLCGNQNSDTCEIGYDGGGSSSTNQWEPTAFGTWPANDPTDGDGDWEGYMYANYEEPSVGDTTPPIINGTINDTNVIQNEHINFTFNLTDEINNEWLNCTIVINDTGAKRYFNFSFDNYVAGNTQQCSQNFSMNTIADVNVTGIATDNSSNQAQNETIFTVTAAPAADTCSPTTPLTSEHIFDANDNCEITSIFNAGGHNVVCMDIGNGGGTLTIKAETYNYNYWLTDKDCIEVCEAGAVGC